MPESSITKILIRTPNWLGDLVMSTGFIMAVQDLYPESEVDLIIKPGFEKLPLPSRGQLRIFDHKLSSPGSFGKTLRGQGYQLFFVLPPSFSSAWMAYQSQIQERIGYKGEFRSWLLTSSKKPQQASRSEHLLQEYLYLLKSGLSSTDYAPHLDISSAWLEKELLPFGGSIPESYFAIAPGAIYGPAKQWPVESYRNLASELNEKYDIPVLVLGTDKDIEAGQTISKDLTNIHNYCGKTTLTQLLAILAKAKLLVSNDSGSMHLMTALKRPQVALFGSTSATWTGPINPQAAVITKNLSCAPCFSRTCRFGHYDCLKLIKPVEVLEQVSKILASA